MYIYIYIHTHVIVSWIVYRSRLPHDRSRSCQHRVCCCQSEIKRLQSNTSFMYGFLFQQPTFQTISNTSMIVQLHMYLFMLFQVKFWNVGCLNGCQTTLWTMYHIMPFNAIYIFHVVYYMVAYSTFDSACYAILCTLYPTPNSTLHFTLHTPHSAIDMCPHICPNFTEMIVRTLHEPRWRENMVGVNMVFAEYHQNTLK